MAIEGLNDDILRHAAASEEGIVIERPPYVVTIYVRRMESWEMPDAEPEPEYRVHPLTRGDVHLGNAARSVGR